MRYFNSILTVPFLAAAVSAGAAHAGDYVATYADASVATGLYGVTGGYNAAGSSSQLDTLIQPGTGVYGAVNCPNQSSVTCGYTLTGSNHDTTGTATSSSNSVSINASTVPFFSYQSTESFSASAAATANLATGTLGAYGTGAYTDLSSSNEPNGGTGTGWAIENDTLHFLVANATASTVTDISVSFTLHGNITLTDGTQNVASGQVESSLNFGNASVTATLSQSQPAATLTFSRPAPTGWVSFNETSDSPGDLSFSGVYAITGATANIGVDASLLADACGLGASCNYLDTAQIGLDLPTGVSYTSDSGVFLSAEATSVAAAAPEAATWGLMLIGFAGIGFMGYRNTRSSPAVRATA